MLAVVNRGLNEGWELGAFSRGLSGEIWVCAGVEAEESPYAPASSAGQAFGIFFRCAGRRKRRLHALKCSLSNWSTFVPKKSRYPRQPAGMTILYWALVGAGARRRRCRCLR